MTPTLEKCRKKVDMLIVFLVEDVSLFRYLAIFILVVVGLGLVYDLLTPYGHGVGKESKPLTDMTFPVGIYFSVVTVSSLGYGDLHPMGVSRVLACGEVLFGLAFIGIVIAKITSRRLSYHVQRLFSSDAHKRLEDFAEQFQQSAQDLREAIGSLGRAYQTTPGEQERPSQDKLSALIGLSSTLASLHSRGVALADHLSFECEQGKYFTIVSAATVTRIGDSIEKCVLVLGQLIISLPNDVRTDILDSQRRQSISDFLDAQKTVCGIVQQFAPNGVKSCFRRVLETCNGVPEQYFAAPVQVAATEQPDQQVHGADEPQEPKEVVTADLPENTSKSGAT